MLALANGLMPRAGPSPLGVVGNCCFGSTGSVIGREDVSAREESCMETQAWGEPTPQSSSIRWMLWTVERPWRTCCPLRRHWSEHSPFSAHTRQTGLLACLGTSTL